MEDLLDNKMTLPFLCNLQEGSKLGICSGIVILQCGHLTNFFLIAYISGLYAVLVELSCVVEKSEETHYLIHNY